MWLALASREAAGNITATDLWKITEEPDHHVVLNLERARVVCICPASLGYIDCYAYASDGRLGWLLPGGRTY